MTDRHPVDDRVRAYMEWRARQDVPAGLDGKVLDAVRSRTSPRRGVAGLIAVGTMALVVFVAIALGIAARGHGSQPSGVGATPTAPVDPCANSHACLTIDVVVSGAQMLSGEQRRPVNSCADVVVTDPEGVFPPRLSGELDGRPVSSFVVIPSAKPGTYQYQASPSYPLDVLDIGDVHYLDAAAGVAATATGTVVIGPNGAGFYNLHGLLDERRPTQTVSLGVSWQCTVH